MGRPLPIPWKGVTDHFLLDYGGFILLPIRVFQLWGLGAQSSTPVAVKDRRKEGIITLATVMFPSVPSKGWRFSLALVWLLIIFFLSFTAVACTNVTIKLITFEIFVTCCRFVMFDLLGYH